MRVRWLLVAAILCALLATPIGSVGAANDYDPPVIVSLAASPTTVAPGGAVTLTAHLTDVGTGINGDTIFAYYNPPSGNSAFAGSWTRAVAGTDQDNTWTSTLTVPAVANSGTWTLSDFSVSDKVGNHTDLIPSNTPCVPQTIANDFFVNNGGAVPAPFPRAICNGAQYNGSGPADGGNTITIRGVDFVSGATITFGTTPATSVAFVSSKELTVVVPRSSQENVDVDVTVKNPDNQARSLKYHYYYYSTPTITSLSPSSATAGSGPVDVRVIGTNFFDGISIGYWKDSARATTFVSATEVKVTLTAADLASAGSGPVTIKNGSSSASASFVINAATTPPSSQATITANPNPVPVGQTSTTITWSTGDGSTGTVCVSDNGQAEAIFDGNAASHSKDAPFINSGSYVFTLYGGGSCGGTKLASVTVAKQVPNTSTTPISLSFTTSTTNLVRSYTVTFDSGDGSVVQVMLSVNGDAERLFTASQFGSVPAPWIFSGVYTFRIVKAGRTFGTITVGTTAQISSPNGTTAGGPSPNVSTTNGTPVLLTFDTGNGQPAALCTQYGGLVSFSQNGAGFANVNNVGTIIYSLHIGACSGPTVAGTVTVASA